MNEDGWFVPGPNTPLDIVFETRFGMTHIDDDGCADLIVVEGLDDEMLVLFGNCDGSFAEPLSVVFDQPTDVATVDSSGAPLDFDGDGNVDIAVSFNGFQNNFAKIMLGDGAGGFVASDEMTAFDVMGRLAAADFDGNGTVDLAVGGKGFGDVMIGLTDGAGHFVDFDVVSGRRAGPGPHCGRPRPRRRRGRRGARIRDVRRPPRAFAFSPTRDPARSRSTA